MSATPQRIDGSIGVAWYTPEAWQQLAAMPEARIEKSYQDFVRSFERTVRGFAAHSGRGIIVYADADLRLAISRSIAVETSRGWRIAKEKAAHKIDVVVALALAAHAAMRRRWDEEVPIVMPFFAGTPRNIPGQDRGVGTNWWPLP
jgi:hypothetical protein